MLVDTTSIGAHSDRDASACSAGASGRDSHVDIQTEINVQVVNSHVN
jgi:hypothetical protein